MDHFHEAWRRTGRAEGGYVYNLHDSGGATNHGITEQVARAHGYKGDMRDLPKEFAEKIAKEQYWDIMRLDDVAALSPAIAFEMFDTGFNIGQARVVRFLQRCLNVANRQQRDYADIVVDGLIGRLTLHSLRMFLSFRARDGETWMLRALNGLQAAYYIELAERREKDEEFVFGWILQRVRIEGEKP